jgi:hypothetical protein
MADLKKCAHPACNCMVGDDEYCSQYCKDAGDDEVEIACDCGHASCEIPIGSVVTEEIA